MTYEEPESDKTLTATAERLRRELDKWFESALSQGERALDAIGLRSDRTLMPPIDILESPDEILVVVDLPGVDPQAIDVSLAGNMLTVKGVKSCRAEDPEIRSHITERKQGEFSRSVPLPAPVNPDSVGAESALGVLRVRIGKVAPPQATKIVIKTAQDPGPGTDVSESVSSSVS